MRKLTLCILLNLGMVFQLAAQFTVLNVKGVVRADGKVLLAGDELLESARVEFSDGEDLVYLLNRRGYFILSPKRAAHLKASEFAQLVRESLLKPEDYFKKGTRSVDTLLLFHHIYEAMAFFRDHVLVTETTDFMFTPDVLEVNVDHYFLLIHHMTNGYVARRLDMVPHGFRLDSTAFQLGSLVLNPREVLYQELIYVDDVTGDQRALGSFTLFLGQGEHMIAELQQLHKALPVKPTEAVFYQDHALPYIKTMYGKVHPYSLQKMVKAAVKRP